MLILGLASFLHRSLLKDPLESELQVRGGGSEYIILHLGSGWGLITYTDV